MDLATKQEQRHQDGERLDDIEAEQSKLESKLDGAIKRHQWGLTPGIHSQHGQRV